MCHRLPSKTNPLRPGDSSEYGESGVSGDSGFSGGSYEFGNSGKIADSDETGVSGNEVELVKLLG